MLRVILRNVQYYLLFFSSLLVLLAFQRLQWYDGQGWLLPHPDALTGRPRGYTPPSSPDGGMIYYGGDESKEIGLFKFRLGLFKFVLPTFSKDDASWERANDLSSLMTVPPPPNKRRKQLRVENRIPPHFHSNEEPISYKQGEYSKSSIAYAVIVRLPPQGKATYTVKSNKDKKVPKNEHEVFHTRAKILSKSIEKAHDGSPYEYKLYAITFSGFPVTGMDGGDQTKQMGEALRALLQSGFQIVNLSDNALVQNAEMVATTGYINQQRQALRTVFTRHDVVVQICIDCLLLEPIDALYDMLLKGKTFNDATGLIGVKAQSLVDKKSGEHVKQVADETTRPDSFVLESSNLSALESELVIFRTSSERATNSFIESLRCMLSNLQNGKHALSFDGKKQSILRLPKITRRNNDDPSEHSEQCGFRTGSSLLLDRCLYDVGHLHVGQNCSHTSVKDDARVAHYLEGNAK